MEPEEYELMYQVETHHWWYLGMEAITRAFLEQCHDGLNGLRVLDAGCGTGAAMTTYLADFGVVTGIDLSRDALAFARRREAAQVAQATVMCLPFAAETFDMVASFDVLYERGVASDVDALKEFMRVLRRGGHLLLRLPAYDWLRGRHDAAVHTARRYTARQVRGLLQQSGLALQRLSYANTILFPFALTKRLAERMLPVPKKGSDLRLNPGQLNRLFQTLLEWEAPIAARIGLPFGLSVVALGRKI